MDRPKETMDPDQMPLNAVSDQCLLCFPHVQHGVKLGHY